MYGSEPGLQTNTTSSTSTAEGGFAKYGSAHQAGTPVFGDRQQGMVVGDDNTNKQSDRGASSVTASANTSKTNEWQDWRSIPRMNQDIDVDRDYAEEFYALDDDSKNSVKYVNLHCPSSVAVLLYVCNFKLIMRSNCKHIYRATPGFAPAKFNWEDD